MYTSPFNIKKNAVLIFLFICIVFSVKTGRSQTVGMYPPFTKWYQDPLGLKPLELSTAFGFVWGSAATAACLILTKNDSAFQKKLSVFSESGYTLSYKPPYTSSLQTDIGIIYELRRWISVGLGWNTFHFKDGINETGHQALCLLQDGICTEMKNCLFSFSMPQVFLIA